MMTIQTQNLVSTERSRKAKSIIVFVILLILLIGTIVYFFPQDRYSCKIYDTPDSVKDLFVSNQESFMEIAYILKDNNELFDYLYSIDRKSIFGPSIPKREKYLSEEEYEHICAFLNEYQPYEIGGIGVFKFVFLCKNDDVVLYYTEGEGEELLSFLSYVGQHAEIEAINDNWYIKVEPSDITRQ